MINHDTHQAFVLKFGGSETITEQGVNREAMVKLLCALRYTLTHCFDRGAFVIGGGVRARLASQNLATERERDEAGMRCTHEHAAELRNYAQFDVGLDMDARIPKNSAKLSEVLQTTTRSVALGGIQTGQTTDAVAFMAAGEFKKAGLEPRIVITSDVGTVRTANPKEDPNALSIASSSIEELIKLGILTDNLKKYRSGMHTPLDPKAVQLSLELQADVLFTSMKDVKSIIDFLAGRPVTTGTMLGPNQPFVTR